MGLFRTVGVLVGSVVVLAGCPGPEQDQTTTTGLTQECTNPDGFSVAYPDGWVTNEEAEDDLPPCSLFDPDPDQLRVEGKEIPLDVAVSVQLEAVPFEEMLRAGEHTEELERRESTVDGRDAVRLELRHTGEGLYPEGTLLTMWMIDRDGVTFVARSADVGEPEYSRTQEILDQMVDSVSFDDSLSCSAQDLEAQLSDQDGLPEVVADTRQAIADAATHCDYERLEELTADQFTYSFGAEGDASGFWRRGELRGSEPLRYLVELLDRPHARIDAGGPRYVWPSAFAYDAWEDVPEADREALRPLYDDDDFARFEQFGGYTGYRVGISEAGEWLFFVAGD